MHEDRDADLIEECKNGNREALASLLTRYERPLYNVAYRMLGNADDAADVTRTVFLKALEHFGRFDQKQSFFSWIYRIAINESIDQVKRSGRQRPLVANPESHYPGPEEASASAGLCASVQQVLMELTEDYRAVIVLRHFTEYSYRQIGAILDIPEKTVKSRLFSARQSMRAKLEQRGILSP